MILPPSSLPSSLSATYVIIMFSPYILTEASAVRLCVRRCTGGCVTRVAYNRTCWQPNNKRPPPFLFTPPSLYVMLYSLHTQSATVCYDYSGLGGIKVYAAAIICTFLIAGPRLRPKFITNFVLAELTADMFVHFCSTTIGRSGYMCLMIGANWIKRVW